MTGANLAAPKVEFVGYTGEYPSLCTGTFLVKIDGPLVAFYYLDTKDGVQDALKGTEWETLEPREIYPDFWESGGGSNWVTDHVWQRKWKLIPYCGRRFPEHIRNLLPALLKVFNENVEHGCCGGCI